VPNNTYLSFDKLNISWLDIFMKETTLNLHNFNNINELVLSNLILQNENIVSNKVNFNNVNLTNSNISSNDIIFKSGDILNSKFINFTKLNFNGTGLLNFVSSLFENINGNISEFSINNTFNEQDKTCKKIFFNTNLSTSTNLKTLSLKFNTFVQFIENNNKRLAIKTHVTIRSIRSTNKSSCCYRNFVHFKQFEKTQNSSQ
jgi:hypothetical protein